QPAARDSLFRLSPLKPSYVFLVPDVRPPQDVLVVALTISGAGPIQGFEGEAILATVEFASPVDPLKTSFHATALLEVPSLAAPISVPITATPRPAALQAVNVTAPV